MADLKEILYTKDKETINKTYKRIKKYAIREDVKIKDIEVMTKEAKILYLLEAFDNEKILSALMRDISLREFYDFDYLNICCLCDYRTAARKDCECLPDMV